MSETHEMPSGRRPLKTRQWPVFQKLAATLARRDVSPNMISVWSVIFATGACGCLIATNHVSHDLLRRGCWLLSALMIQLRLIANLLDGMVAIEGGKKSAVGDLYNEVPDRISDPAILIGAGFAFGGCPLLGLGAALVSVFVAYVRAIGASVGVGQVFLGPFAKQQRMALMTIVCVAGIVLPSRLQILHKENAFGITAAALAVIIVGGLVTSVRRLRKIAELMNARQGKTDASV